MCCCRTGTGSSYVVTLHLFFFFLVLVAHHLDLSHHGHREHGAFHFVSMLGMFVRCMLVHCAYTARYGIIRNNDLSPMRR